MYIYNITNNLFCTLSGRLGGYPDDNLIEKKMSKA